MIPYQHVGVGSLKLRKAIPNSRTHDIQYQGLGDFSLLKQISILSDGMGQLVFKNSQYQI